MILRLFLHHAKSSKIIIALVKCGVDINALDDLNISVISSIVQDAKVENEAKIVKGVEFLINAGVDVTETGRKRYLLHYITDKPNLTRLLLTRGANVDVRDSEDKTPLFFSLKNTPSQRANAKVLLSYNANINAVDAFGDTPLNYSIVAGYDFSNVEFLLKMGAKPYMRNDDGETAFDLLPNDKARDDAHAFYEKITKIVIKHNAEGYSTLRGHPAFMRSHVIEEGLKEIEQNDEKSKKRKLPFAEKVSNKRARTAEDSERGI